MKKRRSVMPHNFSVQPSVSHGRSIFNRRHGHLTTLDGGLLVPFFCERMVTPGDTHILRPTVVCRMNTPKAPIMDNLYFETAYFFVPYRLVWDNFEKFMGQQTDPGDSTDYMVPVVDMSSVSFGVQSPAHYMGIPANTTGLTVSALPFRAYNLIYNNYYRDQNLQDSEPVDKGDGPDDPADYEGCFLVNKRHDYITSCTPTPQKGPEVTLPLGDFAPVIGKETATGYQSLGLHDGTVTFGFKMTNASGDIGIGNTAYDSVDAGSNPSAAGFPGADKVIGVTQDPDKSGIVADLANAEAPSINTVRTAVTMQQFYERDMRGGTRYNEMVLAHFGVRTPDQRIDRPEYLGGDSQRIIIKPVEQNSQTSTTPQGNLTAVGYAAGSQRGFSKSFVEHGCIIGMCYVRGDLRYMQGVERDWSLRNREEWYFPGFAGLGEQAVLSSEVYADGTSGDDDVFGYIPRFEEARMKKSLVTGYMDASITSSLDSWHCAEVFTARPTLGAVFMRENAAIHRVVATTEEPDFNLDVLFDYKSIRPLPTYGVPGVRRI